MKIYRKKKKRKRKKWKNRINLTFLLSLKHCEMLTCWSCSLDWSLWITYELLRMLLRWSHHLKVILMITDSLQPHRFIEIEIKTRPNLSRELLLEMLTSRIGKKIFALFYFLIEKRSRYLLHNLDSSKSNEYSFCFFLWGVFCSRHIWRMSLSTWPCTQTSCLGFRILGSILMLEGDSTLSLCLRKVKVLCRHSPS